MAIFLLRGDIKILVNDIFELQIPVITEEAILPEPINFVPLSFASFAVT